MEFNTNVEWLRRMAALENNCEIGVGGWMVKAGIPIPRQTPVSEASASPVAFAKLIRLRRRERGDSVEQLAERADIELAELIDIEAGIASAVEPRTVFQLGNALNLPTAKLMEVAGLVKAEGTGVASAAVRFAARSEPVGKLTDEERNALTEFVKVLAQG